MVQNIRANKIDKFPITDGLCDMVIPPIYTVTNKNKQFLMYDSEDGKNRILMFSTTKNLSFLKSCDLWHCDGTFKVVPILFSQLYSIHGFVDGKTLPLVYFLLPSKKKNIYQSFDSSEKYD